MKDDRGVMGITWCISCPNFLPEATIALDSRRLPPSSQLQYRRQSSGGLEALAPPFGSEVSWGPSHRRLFFLHVDTRRILVGKCGICCVGMLRGDGAFAINSFLIQPSHVPVDALHHRVRYRLP